LESKSYIGYVLISLNSNFIIPVARSDEHQKGEELLYYFINKYKIKNLKYESVFTIGNNYVYGGEYHNNEFNALSKAYEYGCRDIMVNFSGKDKSMGISDYVKFNGDINKAIEHYKTTKQISKDGQYFINELKTLTSLFERYHTNTMYQTNILESNIIKHAKKLDTIMYGNNILYSILCSGKENYKKFDKALDNKDINTIGDCIFTHNGIKNTIHILLKKDDKTIENALEQFNAMNTIKNNTIN
jgi:hypothetical protein